VDSTAVVQGLPRPLITAVVIAIVLQLLATGLLRNPDRGALLALLVMIGLATPPEILLGASGLAAAGLAVGMVRRIPFALLPWTSLTRWLNLVGGLMVVLAVWTAASSGALTASSPPEQGPAVQPQAGAPDIYVILLDGYPRSDTLAEQFGFDNEPFIKAMSERGFEVARNSYSNYNVTSLTIASMLNMAQINEVVTNPPEPNKAQYRALARATNDALGVVWLRQAGYEIVAIPSPFSFTTLYAADRVLDSGDVTDFELALLQIGLSRLVLSDLQGSWLANSHRNRIRSAFATLGELAAERDVRPKFVLAHLLAPHLPFVFGANGEDRPPWPCFPAQCPLFDDGQRFVPGAGTVPITEQAPYVSALQNQVTYVNKLVLAAADEIITKSSAPPVIIVFSDHGHRHNWHDRDEALRSILFARTPGHSQLFPDDATPINILPRIANAYYEAGIPLASEQSYFVDARAMVDGDLFNFVAVESDGNQDLP
jgi:hypothetical protein